MSKILNFAKAVTKYAISGFTNVSEDKYNERLSICESCPLNYNGECGLCGCPVVKKCLWATEACPDGKWRAEIASGDSKSQKIDTKKGGFTANSSKAPDKVCKPCQARTK